MQRPGARPILVINAGSSSIKFALFDDDLQEHLSGQATEIGGDARLIVDGRESAANLADHRAALAAILAQLQARGYGLDRLAAAAHRVVHGGAYLTRPQRITAAVFDEIQACSDLAPLHNPHNLSGIAALGDLAPSLPQYASFDTAFHATNPKVATTYAVPEDWHKSNIRRFGFHGISYQALTANYARQTGSELPQKLLAMHLGNGASLCAIRDGVSVATTMGYSPLEGLTMGTRSGSIDAGAALEMAARTSPAQVLATLNNASGLLALSGGTSDMRALLASDDPRAKFAVQHFCYWAARHAGSMIAAMGGVDAIAFTGGIGENAPQVRHRIQDLLAWANVPTRAIHVIAAREERQIAENALREMQNNV
jgi:acetate kinase